MYECNDKMVSHPSHYQGKNGLEVINVIEAFTADLKGIEATDTGNVLKYMCRWKAKNGVQDLKKALWYLTDLIEHVEKSGMTNDKENMPKNSTQQEEVKNDINPIINFSLDVLFDNQNDPKRILEIMVGLLKTYGSVTLFDYLELVNQNLPLLTFDFKKYGWKDLTSAKVVATKSGNFYAIVLPEPIKL